MKRDYPGAVVDKLYVDREQAKIRWFSKSFQWTTVAKDIVIENSTSRSFLPIVSPIEEKHSLLQLADMFIYAQGRELTGRALEFGNLMSKDVFLERVGQEGIDEIVRGMPEDVAAYWANKHSVEL